MCATFEMFACAATDTKTERSLTRTHTHSWTHTHTHSYTGHAYSHNRYLLQFNVIIALLYFSCARSCIDSLYSPHLFAQFCFCFRLNVNTTPIYTKYTHASLFQAILQYTHTHTWWFICCLNIFRFFAFLKWIRVFYRVLKCVYERSRKQSTSRWGRKMENYSLKRTDLVTKKRTSNDVNNNSSLYGKKPTPKWELNPAHLFRKSVNWLAK